MSEYTYEDLKKIMRGRKHFEIIDFPGIEGLRIAIKVLSQGEVEQCTRACDFVVEKLPKGKDTQGADGIYTREMARQLIFRSVMKVPVLNNETGEYDLVRFFPDADSIKELGIDIIEMLVTSYTTIQEKFSPAQTLKSADDFERIIEEIKKKSTLGLSLSTYELTTLLDFIVKNPEILQKDNGTSSSHLNSSKQSGSEKPSIKVRVRSQEEETQENSL